MDFALFIVWVNIFKDDGPETAAGSAVIPDEPRVQQFHDENRRLARAIAPVMGIPAMSTVAAHLDVGLERFERNLDPGYLNGPPAAYDAVFFYGPDAEWKDGPPTPDDWLTQLVPNVHTGLDPERFFWEFDFYDELERRGAQHLPREPDVSDDPDADR